MNSVHRSLFFSALAIAFACSSGQAGVEPKGVGTGGLGAAGVATTGGTGTGGTDSGGNGGSAATAATAGTAIITPPDGGGCNTKTCAELDWQCGYTIDDCGTRTDCAMCAAGEVCVGGLETPTRCMSGGAGVCPVCSGIPDCAGMPQLTMLSGRVITPGRTDADVNNQVGVPNATVYLLRTSDEAELPAMPMGIPADGLACDRCEDQNLGPVLAGDVTDATGAFTIEEYVPVGVELVLVVKAGRFRRATTLTLPAEAACQTTTLPTTLPDNPTRLPRDMADGLAVNIPRIAVTTGQIDAMECVLEKMGLNHAEFANPGGAERVHLYRGGSPTPAMGQTLAGSGARIDDMTPHSDALYGSVPTILGYDLVVADCEGQTWDSSLAERMAMGASVIEFVNRGGRMFASHLSFSWLHENGMDAYTEATALTTGLGPAGTWTTTSDQATSGTGVISVGRPSASPRVQNFADWMVNEGVTTAPTYDFMIREPRSMNLTLGPTSEEFVYLSDGTMRVQQFSFNTPYGAPEAAACGRVAYSGFHVSAAGGQTPFANVLFPEHCTGDLTDQEKVLLYMLFDLGACIGDFPPPPDCDPQNCESLGAMCGYTPDGCGAVLDCGPCRPPT